MIYQFICPVCNKNFSSLDKTRITCSKKCLYEHQSRTVVKFCKTCKKKIVDRASRFRRNRKYFFCNQKCHYKWERTEEAMDFSILRDKQWCIEQYKQLSLRKIAEKIGCGETTVYKWFKFHGIKLNRSQWISGSRHYFWKNGITELARAIRTSQKYLKWRRAVIEQNEPICVICGTTENLEVDHIKKFKFILIDNNIKILQEALECKELWDVKNGRILCASCNKRDCNINRKTSADN